MIISWQPAELPRDAQSLGHGVCIFSAESTREEPRLAAFVAGFDWLARPAESVVRFDPTSFPVGPAGESLRAEIEALIRAGQRRFPREIAPGFAVHVNG